MNNEHLSIETLVDYLHHELDPHDDARVMQHLTACADCRTQHERQISLTEALHAYGRTTYRDMPAGVVARIWDVVEGVRPEISLADRFRAFLRPAYALPAAAVLVLAVYFGVVAPHNSNLATIDAAYYLEDHAALTNTVPFNEGTVVPASLERDETGSDQHWVASTGTSDIAADR